MIDVLHSRKRQIAQQTIPRSWLRAPRVYGTEPNRIRCNDTWGVHRWIDRARSVTNGRGLELRRCAALRDYKSDDFLRFGFDAGLLGLSLQSCTSCTNLPHCGLNESARNSISGCVRTFSAAAWGERGLLPDRIVLLPLEHDIRKANVCFAQHPIHPGCSKVI